MDFNQLLSLAKKNKEKNEKQIKNIPPSRPIPKPVEIKKELIQTPTFCKPFVPPPPQPKKEKAQPVLPLSKKNDLSSSKTDKKPQKVAEKPKEIVKPTPKPTSFSDLLLLAKKNVNQSSSSSSKPAEPSEKPKDRPASSSSSQKGIPPKPKVQVPLRSLNEVKARPMPSRPQPTKPKSFPISSQNNNNNKSKQINSKPAPQRHVNNSKVVLNPPSKKPVEKVTAGVRRPLPPPQNLPRARPPPAGGPVRSGIAAQLGSMPAASRGAYSEIEPDYYDSEDDYDSDFIDDSEDVDEKQYSKVVKIIQKTMNFDPSKYEKVSRFDDLKNMESSYRQLEKENARSARLGAKEDREDILAELEKKRRRAEKY